MSGNQYRALHPSLIATFGDGVFEHEFTVLEERDWLERGLLVIEPRPYRTLTDRYTVDGTPIATGAVVELALPIEVEAALVAGGHLARVRRDAHPTGEAEAAPEPDPVTPRPRPRPRRRTSTPVKE